MYGEVGFFLISLVNRTIPLMQILRNSVFLRTIMRVMRGIGVPNQIVFPSLNFYGMKLFSYLDSVFGREKILKVGCHQLNFACFEKFMLVVGICSVWNLANHKSQIWQISNLTNGKFVQSEIWFNQVKDTPWGSVRFLKSERSSNGFKKCTKKIEKEAPGRKEANREPISHSVLKIDLRSFCQIRTTYMTDTTVFLIHPFLIM